jgi:Domain of unknown function (DUF1937)
MSILKMERPKMVLANLRVYSFLYLATPYSKYQGGLQRAFEDAAKLTARLLINHIKIYSPIVHTHPIAVYGELNPLDHSIWLPFDEAIMRVAPALLVAEMEGWKESYGVDQEIKIFGRDGKPIHYINPNSLAIR